ncbi:hypothetical protein BKA65DRAFT_34619 [Rhexocercosporidium sp. MPI-PUGE-AT-0058]|nr:hypothetical protein BKA65DRAFT_34619 [Rhexocercosporidium sp. MPI-PUGE-AT-0058]
MKLHSPLTLLYLAVASNALVTLDTIRNLTEGTDGYRRRITDLGSMGLGSDGVGVGGDGGRGQVVMGGAAWGGDEGDGGDEGEIEDTVAAALRMLCTDILIELEKPLTITPPPSSSSIQTDCKKVKDEYHAFLAATVRFLHVVQERQMVWRWGSESTVFEGVGWMQGLWASRSTNSQNRSFIEQQMSMYAETGCFGKSNEVLRRDVEVVEYLNDLLDLFG